MPTVITHAAVPLCIGLGLGSKVIPPRLLFAGIILAMLPDTGERYLTTPLFEDILEGMNDEERALSLSTPGYQME